MVEIDHDKCSQCGLCISICHECCITLYNERLHIDHDLCSTCSQCVAVCPNQALSWNGHPALHFETNRFPTPNQLDELLRQRRTIRHFKTEKPDRKILEEIVMYGAYAPTHSHDFRIIVIDDDDILDQLDETVYRFNKRIYTYLYKPRLIEYLIHSLFPSHRMEYDKARPKLEKSLKIGRAYESMPPVIICIVGDKRVPLSLESAQYILFCMDLYARSRDLGCRNLVGNQMFLNRDKIFRNRIHIKKSEKIFAVMGIGYPAINFRNKVMGRTMNTRWNDRISD